MKKIKLLVVSVLLFSLIPKIAISASERRTALVIGNGNYKLYPLRNPVNDAIDITNALRGLGFSVTLKTNVDQRIMEDSIRRFGRKLKKGGVGLFYFAGHGLQVKGINYLIPVGANIDSEADVKYETVNAGRVLTQMEVAENILNIVILDACRDNPFARSFRSVERGLAKMDAPTGSILAYATSPGSIALDGNGRNGLYTSILLKHIKTPGLEIGRLFRRVRSDVMEVSNKKQITWESSSLIGEFYFNPQKSNAVVSKPNPKPISSKIPSQKPSWNIPTGDAGTALIGRCKCMRSTAVFWVDGKKAGECGWGSTEHFGRISSGRHSFIIGKETDGRIEKLQSGTFNASPKGTVTLMLDSNCETGRVLYNY